MERSRTSSIDRLLPVELKREVMRAVVDQPPESPTVDSVFDRFGLAEKGLNPRTFRNWATYIRLLARTRAIGQLRQAIAGSGELGEDVARLLQQELFDRLVGEDRSPKDLMMLAASLRSVRGSEIDAVADQRAADKHADWKRKLQAEQAKALAGVAETQGLTPEQVREIREKLLGE